MKELINYVFCALCMVCQATVPAKIAKTATGKACNKRKTLGQLQLVYVTVTNVRTLMLFSQQSFSWFWSQEKTKCPQAFMAKPADCLARIWLWPISVILSYVYGRNCSLNRLSLWLLFFSWFPDGKSAACKKIPE